jgi:hypothetical protein
MGVSSDGSNPCRHVQKYSETGTTRFVTDEELQKPIAHMDRADREGLKHPSITLAIRLQFEFATCISEVLMLKWDWVDFEQRRVSWLDSKTGKMTKPLSDKAHRLQCSALRKLSTRLPVNLRSHKADDEPHLSSWVAAHFTVRLHSPCRCARHPPSRRTASHRSLVDHPNERVSQDDAALHQNSNLRILSRMSSLRTRPMLFDVANEMVLEVALNGQADAIVTHNVRDFRPARRFGITIATPGEIVGRLNT